jgi:Arc/MetJ family transcription regulator
VRTNIVIDDGLMKEAMQRSGLKTKRAVVEEALRTYVRLKKQGDIKNYFGKLEWVGDLDAMRRD